MPTEVHQNYDLVNGRLRMRGITLRQWAMKNGIPVGSVYEAVAGRRNGPVAVNIRYRINAFLGPITQNAHEKK